MAGQKFFLNWIGEILFYLIYKSDMYPLNMWDANMLSSVKGRK